MQFGWNLVPNFYLNLKNEIVLFQNGQTAICHIYADLNINFKGLQGFSDTKNCQNVKKSNSSQNILTSINKSSEVGLLWKVHTLPFYKQRIFQFNLSVA